MSTPSGTIRVLHVDDEQAFADMVATFIEREDERISVETATNAEEGLGLLEEKPFDCIVSDYDMPRQNGIEFLEAVRTDHDDLPFILFTGKGSEEIASEAISAGVTDYLQKGPETSRYTVLANRITNVVEQYRSRLAIEETERKLSQLAEHTDDILFMFNGDWSELLFVNSAYEAVWGGSIDELYNDPASFLEYVHPDDRPKADEAVKQIANGETSVVEYRVVHPNGEQRWIHGETKPLFDDDGSVYRIVGYVRDITERKRRQEELEDANDQLANAIEAGALGTWEWHIQSDRLVTDPEFARTFGVDPERAEEGVELDRFVSRIHEDDRERVERKIDAAIRDCGDYEAEYRVWDAEDGLRWVLARGHVDCLDDGTPVKFPGVLVDITERKQT